ncbi:DUF6541 family protein [Pseudokineococcus marinus]
MEAGGVEVPPLPALATWPEVWPVVLLAVAVVVGPGLLLALAAGLRGLLAWACAPPLGVSLLAVGAVVSAPLAPWSPRTALACLAVALVATALVRVLLRARSRGSGAPVEPRLRGRPARRARALTVLALLVGAVAGAGPLVGALSSPALVPQRFDAVFHLNAVRYVLDTGRGSTFDLGLLTSSTRGFYPAAWHDLVALVAAPASALPTGAGTGASWDLLPVATNVTAVVLAALAWPAGVVLLTRRLAPGRPVALVAAAALCGAFPLYPALMLNWGVVYPTYLSVALLPAALAVVLRALDVVGAARRAPRPARPGGGAVRAAAGPALLAAALVPGIALAHPTGAAGLAVLALPAAVVVLAGVVRAAWARPAGRRAVVVAGALGLLLAGGAAAAVVASPLVRTVAGVEWPAATTAPQAVGEALLGAPPEGRGGAAWWASAAALLGAGVLVARGRRRAVLVGAALVGGLYVVGRSTDSSVLTALWYNDPVRIAPLLVVVVAPLAGVGLAALVARRPGGRSRPVVALLLVVLLGAAATAAPGSGVPAAQRSLAQAYASDAAAAPLVDPQELALLAALDDLVPPDALIADDPHDGGALAYALADRRVLFPHLSGTRPPLERLLAESLDEAGADPAVCAAVRDLGVTHVLDLGGPSYFATPRTDELFAGLRAASASSPVLEVVATSGRSRLLAVRGC